MASKAPLVRLKHIQIEIAFLVEYTESSDISRFASDPLLFRAVERSLLIISEAAKSLPAELMARYPQVDWRKIADLGNVLRHDYNRVDPETIWNIVSDRIPDLAPLIEQMISDLTAE